MDPIALCISVIVAIVVMLGIAQAIATNNQQRLQAVKIAMINEAKNKYENALAELRVNPTSPTVHEKALNLGRLYSAATRENRFVTLFDETALANDIRAATANASQQVATVQSAVIQTPTLEDRIKALKKLKESGLISDEEFAQKRKEILDSI